MATITNVMDETIAPVAVLDYAVSRQSRNVVLEPLGSEYPTVFLRPAQSRAGTLSLLFNGYLAARNAEAFLSAATRFTFAEVAIFETWDFIVTGAVTRTHVPGTNYWTVNAEVREVEAL